jgi:methyl-accepting chemotaxis protein
MECVLADALDMPVSAPIGMPSFPWIDDRSLRVRILALAKDLVRAEGEREVRVLIKKAGQRAHLSRLRASTRDYLETLQDALADAIDVADSVRSSDDPLVLVKALVLASDLLAPEASPQTRALIEKVTQRAPDASGPAGDE